MNCNVILSGSSDGLLCTSNADEDDEDEATINVGNWGCSISKAGWADNGSDPDKATIWAGSDMETFSTWKGDVCFPSSANALKLTLDAARTTTQY